VLDEAPYRRNIPVALAFHSLEVERSAGRERDNGAAAVVLVARVVVGVADVTSASIIGASAMRESGEKIREAELLMLNDPDRYSRKIRMEDLDLAVEVQ
jgi:hypothetical protein